MSNSKDRGAASDLSTSCSLTLAAPTKYSASTPGITSANETNGAAAPFGSFSTGRRLAAPLKPIRTSPCGNARRTSESARIPNDVGTAAPGACNGNAPRARAILPDRRSQPVAERRNVGEPNSSSRVRPSGCVTACDVGVHRSSFGIFCFGGLTARRGTGRGSTCRFGAVSEPASSADETPSAGAVASGAITANPTAVTRMRATRVRRPFTGSPKLDGRPTPSWATQGTLETPKNPQDRSCTKRPGESSKTDLSDLLQTWRR